MKQLLLIALLMPLCAYAEDYVITIKDHKFSPAEITIPANEKIKLIVKNDDPTPEEFESHELNREKIIAGNSKTTLFIGPLKPGRYPFFGEFNPKTAQGVIIAK
ncbi:MAG: cupredoxin domain-containing protein [Gallionella sp.]